MPPGAASSTAAAATSVLPLPTSPCSKRFIGTSAHVARDLIDHAMLRVGRSEGQGRDETLVPVSRRHDRGRAPGCFAARALERGGQRDAEELFEDDPPPAGLDLFQIARRMDGVPGCAQRGKALRFHQRLGQGVDAAANEPVEVLYDRRADRARRELFVAP